MVTIQPDLFAAPHEFEDPRDCWGTRAYVYDPINAEFRFKWDLAASRENTKCPDFISIDEDALLQDWTKLDGPCWANPPFSRLDEFVEKAARTVDVEGAPTIVLIMPITRNEQGWFHKWVVGRAAELRVFKTRVDYEPAEGIAESGPGFGSQLVIFRPGHTGPTILGSQFADKPK